MLLAAASILAVAQQAGDRQVDVVPQAGAVPLHPAIGPSIRQSPGATDGSASSTTLPAKPRACRDGVDFLGRDVQIVVGDPDDHPGLVDQLGDDGAEHGLHSPKCPAARQIGQQLAGIAAPIWITPSRWRAAVSAALCTIYSSWSASRSVSPRISPSPPLRPRRRWRIRRHSRPRAPGAGRPI